MSLKKLFVIGLAMLSVAILVGCSALSDLNFVTGSGNTVTREFDLSDFDEVSIENAFQGTITRGDNYRVVVTFDDNLEDLLNVDVSDSRLTIGFTKPTAVTNANLSYEIIMPALKVVEASGASQAQIAGFSSGDALRAEASGASRIEGDISSGDADLNASGASTILLIGTGGDLRGEASGASTLDLTDFVTADADVVASGASRIIVNTTGRLDAEASGASNIQYQGQPTLGNIDASGGSNINPQ
ncbi:MAG TPA: head GIN domain-containing protein [Promineifilum sp.]|nr:head GIN domain-containing protein [Promineifilum sp.]HQF71958.1 head GIN domain-containing protein [Promineifilum sp.]